MCVCLNLPFLPSLTASHLLQCVCMHACKFIQCNKNICAGPRLLCVYPICFYFHLFQEWLLPVYELAYEKNNKLSFHVMISFHFNNFLEYFPLLELLLIFWFLVWHLPSAQRFPDECLIDLLTNHLLLFLFSFLKLLWEKRIYLVYISQSKIIIEGN